MSFYKWLTFNLLTLIYPLIYLGSFSIVDAQSLNDRCKQKFIPNGDKLNYSSMIDLNQFKGMSFLNLMQKTIKPAIDEFAVQGYLVADANTIDSALTSAVVGAKVCRAAAAQGQLDEIKAIAQNMHDSGKKFNYLSITQGIDDFGGRPNQFKLAYFLGLVSGGGVAVKIDAKNYYYNVHYGDGKTKDDERTGRSYGATPEHGADDVSDATYLETLQELMQKRTPTEIAKFYEVIINILTNVDTNGYSSLPEIAQTVGTDFLAVYTAEQDRHLMSNFDRHPWDIALLEVTLLGAFHSGQEKIKVMFQGKLTDTTLKQASGCEVREKTQPASLVDYWQFSTNPDPESCRRSGINITKKEFRALGQFITEFERSKNPSLVAEVEKAISAGKNLHTKNLFASFTSKLIDLKAPSKYANYKEISKAMVSFLMQVRLDANEITTFIEEKQKIQP